MILSHLIGGLGNQMFQYACGRALALDRHEELRLDLSGFEDQSGLTPRQYRLGNYPIHATIATTDQLKPYLAPRTSLALANKILKKLWPRLQHKSGYAKEYRHGFHPEQIPSTEVVFLDGYWQDERYFSTHADMIRSELTLPEEAWSHIGHTLRDRIKQQRCASLHVRRTDYLKPENARYFALCTERYYRQAIEILREKNGIERLFIFSDDVEWIRSRLPRYIPHTIISDPQHGLSDMEELALMSQCDHHIIANSSFSWWGAWLNPSSDKHVIAPDTWYIHPRFEGHSPAAASWTKISL
jgi:hypothetical protein